MLEHIKNWWEEISEREQKLTLIAGVIIFFVIVYSLLWQPLSSNLAENKQKLAKVEQTLQWTEVTARTLVSQGINQNKKSQRKQNLSQLINRTSKRNNITISRINNQKKQVDVWIDNIEFTQFLKWITLLKNESNVHVVSVDISQQEIEGMVKINRLSLSY